MKKTHSTGLKVLVTVLGLVASHGVAETIQKDNFEKGKGEKERPASLQSTCLEPPFTDEAVMTALAKIQVEIARNQNVQTLPNRERFIRDLVAVLQMSGQQDRFRIAYLDSPLPRVPIGNLKEVTVARIIRCLGDLHADEAAEVIAEFLLLPSDTMGVMQGLPRDGDIPSAWSLFLIGDAVLPAIRSKLTSADSRVRYAAMGIVYDIRGPWALELLDQWINEATTREDKELLNKPRRAFASEAKCRHFYSSFDDYRKQKLEQGQMRLKLVLDRSSSAPGNEVNRK